VSFFIGFPLLTGCGSGRDQPNHFFALFIGEQCVNNKENRAWAKFANGVVPFLILIVKNVSNRHSVWVIEDQGGGWEINAVSREVVFVLLLVVFESHPVTQTEDTTVYIHMSIQRFGAIGIGGRSGLLYGLSSACCAELNSPLISIILWHGVSSKN
jgi:hypothetical protein